MTDATARLLGFAPVRSATAFPAVTAADALYAVLRIGTGVLFLQHGLQKLFGVLGGFMAPGATAPLFSLLGLAGVLEFGGGLLLIAGLLTRPVALALAAQMVVAYFIAHSPQGGWPVQNGGELALLYALIFAFLAWNGSGSISIDGVIARQRAANGG
jgi:putative oxidoreductase